MSVGAAGFEEYCREGRVLSESDANGNPICDYIYLGKNLAGKRYASGGIYYYHTDPAGTPLAVTDDKAAVVWRGYYEPFGNEYAVQGTASNDVRFAGNKKDDETGLNHFGARYMDSLLGRFMAPDPVGPVDSKTGKINDKILTEPQRLNAYAYGLNGPGRYVDRDGEQVIEAYELIVFGVSVLAAVGMQQQMSKPQKDGRKGSSPSFAGESTPGTPDPDDPNSKFGSRGTKVMSQTVWRGEQGRIDVENQNPGQRPGQIHFQTGGNKYMYDPTNGQFRDAPASINKMLEDPEVQRAMSKALQILGE